MKKTVFILTIILLTGMGAAQSSSQLNLSVHSYEPIPLKTSEYADIWVELTNEGDNTANNVDLEFMENYPFTVDPDDRKSWDVGTIAPGEIKVYHLEAKVDENAVHGENELKFKTITPTVDIEHKMPIEVRSDRTVLSIKDIEFPDKTAPGSRPEMKLTFENLADSQLKNIEVELDVSSDDLPFGTSEAAFQNIPSLEPDQTESLSFTLDIDESAERSVYKLPIDLSYEDEAGTEFEKSTTTSVNVGGEPKLEAGLNTEEHLSPGETTEVTFRVVNRGHGSAEFIEMELKESENLEVIGKQQTYIGSMDPDDFQTASYQVYISEESENFEGFPVELSYTDNQEEKTLTQQIDAEVYNQDELNRYGLNSSSMAIPIAIVVIVILGVAGFYWRKRRRN